jgi:hypothetical protein
VWFRGLWFRVIRGGKSFVLKDSCPCGLCWVHEELWQVEAGAQAQQVLGGDQRHGGARGLAGRVFISTRDIDVASRSDLVELTAQP